MNKAVFKVISIVLGVIDIIFLLLLMLSIILTLAGVWFFNLMHMIVFITAIALNVGYIIYAIIILQRNRKRKR